MKKKSSIGIAIAVFLALLSGCSKNYKKQIEGRWVVSEAVHTDFEGSQFDVSDYAGIPVEVETQFTFSDKCYIENSQTSITCAYKVKEDTIEFLLDNSESVDMDYIVNGDMLILDRVLMAQQSVDSNGDSSGIQEETLHIELQR